MPTGSSNRSGPPPKPADKRRNTTKPANWGLAEPVLAGQAAKQPDLGFPNAHPLVERLWATLGRSVESKFFSEADWGRASWEFFYANELFTGSKVMTPTAWQTVQTALNGLLVSPAEKRRAGIELKAAVDEDAQAAVDIMANYKDKLAG